MRPFIAGLAFLLSFAAAAEQTTGQRFKSDVKGMARQTKDAAVDVGHQVRDGTKKTYRSTKAKARSDVKDVKAGREPGDGRHAAREEARARAQQGRK